MSKHFKKHTFSRAILSSLGLLALLIQAPFLAQATNAQAAEGEFEEIETVEAEEEAIEQVDSTDLLAYMDQSKPPRPKASNEGAYLKVLGDKAPIEIFATATADLRNTWTSREFNKNNNNYQLDIGAKFTEIVTQNLERVQAEKKEVQADKKLSKKAKEERVAELVDAELVLKHELKTKETIQKSSKLFGEVLALTLTACSSNWKSRGALVGNDKVMRCSEDASKKISDKFKEIAEHDQSLYNPDLKDTRLIGLAVESLFRNSLNLGGGKARFSDNDAFEVFGITTLGCDHNEKNTPVCEVGINTLEVMPADYAALTPGERFIWDQMEEAKAEHETEIAQKDLGKGESESKTKEPAKKAASAKSVK